MEGRLKHRVIGFLGSFGSAPSHLPSVPAARTRRGWGGDAHSRAGARTARTGARAAWGGGGLAPREGVARSLSFFRRRRRRSRCRRHIPGRAGGGAEASGRAGLQRSPDAGTPRALPPGPRGPSRASPLGPRKGPRAATGSGSTEGELGEGRGAGG